MRELLFCIATGIAFIVGVTLFYVAARTISDGQMPDLREDAPAFIAGAAIVLLMLAGIALVKLMDQVPQHFKPPEWAISTVIVMVLVAFGVGAWMYFLRPSDVKWEVAPGLEPLKPTPQYNLRQDLLDGE